MMNVGNAYQVECLLLLEECGLWIYSVEYDISRPSAFKIRDVTRYLNFTVTRHPGFSFRALLKCTRNIFWNRWIIDDFPAGTQRWNNVNSTLIKRHDIETTFNWRCCNVVILPGLDSKWVGQIQDIGFLIRMNLAIYIYIFFYLQITLILPNNFPVNWSFCSKEVQNRVSRWRPSWISDQNKFSYFWSTNNPDTSYQVSSKLAVRFRRSAKQISKKAVIVAILS